MATRHSSFYLMHSTDTLPCLFTGKEHRDWSWRVRFAAVQGLVRICRHCSGDNTRDGMCGVAWNQLMRHHSLERDVRVLEAWKLAQVRLVFRHVLPIKFCMEIDTSSLNKFSPIVTKSLAKIAQVYWDAPSFKKN